MLLVNNDDAVDIEKLQDKALEILRREINNLFKDSSNGKLGAAGARDLVAYIKLLDELAVQQKAAAAEAAILAAANKVEHFVRG